MAKIVESYLAFKLSKLVKDSDDNEIELSNEVTSNLVEIIEAFLKESNISDIIVEVVDEG